MILRQAPSTGISLLVAAVFSFVGSPQAQEAKAPDPAVSAKATPSSEVQSKETADSVPSGFLTNYKLVHQDKVKFRIDEDPVREGDFPELIVSSLGHLSFPVSRSRQSPMITVTAVGKTLDQVKAELVAQLEADYYHKATVTIQLTSKSERLGKVTFVGDMIRGFIPINPGEPKKLSEAIIEKGYTEFANLRKVKIIRNVPGGKPPKEIIVDVDAILHKGRKDLDQILEDGDYVNVPEKGFVF